MWYVKLCPKSQWFSTECSGYKGVISKIPSLLLRVSLRIRLHAGLFCITLDEVSWLVSNMRCLLFIGKNFCIHQLSKTSRSIYSPNYDRWSEMLLLYKNFPSLSEVDPTDYTSAPIPLLYIPLHFQTVTDNLLYKGFKVHSSVTFYCTVTVTWWIMYHNSTHCQKL